MGETILQADVVNYYENGAAITPRTKTIVVTVIAVSLIWLSAIGVAWGIHEGYADDNISDIVAGECRDQINDYHQY